jgi:Tannase and feruloyl esterase
VRSRKSVADIEVGRARETLWCTGWMITSMWLVCCSPASATIPGCTLAALKALAPSEMIIGQVPNLVILDDQPKINTINGVQDVPANALGDGAAEFCYVTGQIVTNASAHKTTHFAVALPNKANWNGKFMFQGCGGNCGVVYPPNLNALHKGYPVWGTDDGHVAKPSPDPRRLWREADATWMIDATGHRDEEAITDYYHRAVHVVTEVGKEFTRRYYRAGKLPYSYFQGCSDGGREAMVELAQYPADYEGIIAGAPYFDIANQLAVSLVNVVAQLRSPDSAVPLTLFQAADDVIMAQCDGADGVKDGLIQNPALCHFDALQDLPRYDSSGPGRQCYAKEQLESLNMMFSSIRSPTGQTLYPGYSVSNLYAHLELGESGDLLSDWLGFLSPANELNGLHPWGLHARTQPQSWYIIVPTTANLVYDGANSFNALNTPGIAFIRDTSNDELRAVMPENTAALLLKQTKVGSAAEPSEASTYFKMGHKLIMYHGFSDGDITPYRTIQYYRKLAELNGGVDALRRNALLFMVPGMAHCEGGPGPNNFAQGTFSSENTNAENNILTALERWVENKEQPKQLLATKFEGDDVHGPVLRTMPLCPFPAMAKYKGVGNLSDAVNWTCAAGDRRLDDKGPAGVRAGAYAELR